MDGAGSCQVALGGDGLVQLLVVRRGVERSTPGHFFLDVAKELLLFLVRPIVVVPEHPHHRHQHHQAGEGEDDVQGSFDCDMFYRWRPCRPAPATLDSRVALQMRLALQATRLNQMLKKYSGMNTMYFRLNVQRSTILIGSDAMNWISVTSMMKRTKPILMKKRRKTVLASSGGSSNR